MRVRVCVASGGPFYAFDLARQMDRLGCLERLYTGFPAWKVKGLPRSKVACFPWLMVPAVIAGRVGFEVLGRRLNLAAIETFDRWVAQGLKQCDVFHALSGFGTLSHETARDRWGALTVCDRGSAHILTQKAILEEEYERNGIPFRGPDPRVVERELEEYESCDRITVPSSFAYRSFLERRVPEEKLWLNPFGVDRTMFRPEPKEDGVFRVIYVGRMSVRKGLPILLEAIAQLRIPNCELLLVGSIEPEMENILSRYRRVYRYIGPQPKRELFKYYSQASVFVLASIEEGLALVQAEAMACGLPVIATTNTGAEDLFTDGVEGFIVPIRSPEAISEKILYLYEHPAVRDQMAAAALERARRLAGWDRYGEGMLTCYREGLGSRGRGGERDADSLR